MSVSDPTKTVTGSALSNVSRIISEQGMSALWRGNMPNVYRSLSLVMLRVTIYDKIKQAYMPLDQSQYVDGTLDYYWRKYFAALSIIGITTALVYPLDLIHTRMSTDMTSKREIRLF